MFSAASSCLSWSWRGVKSGFHWLTCQPSLSVQVQRWLRKLNRQRRILQQEISQLDREARTTRQLLRQAVRRGAHTRIQQAYAQEQVRTEARQAVLIEACGHIDQLRSMLRAQAATAHVSVVLTKSTELMQELGHLYKLPTLGHDARIMAREVARAGEAQHLLSSQLQSEDTDFGEIDSVVDPQQAVADLISRENELCRLELQAPGLAVPTHLPGTAAANWQPPHQQQQLPPGRV